MQWPESRKERGTTSEWCSQVIGSSPPCGLRTWHVRPQESLSARGWVLSRVLGVENPALLELPRDPAFAALL